MLLMRANPLLGGHWKGLALLVSISGPKKVSIQSPLLPMAIEMDLPASKSSSPAPYKQHVHYWLKTKF